MYSVKQFVTVFLSQFFPSRKCLICSYGVAGAVLLIVFSTEDSNTIDRMTVKKLYSVFTVVSLIANLTFLFLRRPSKTTVATETLDYNKLLGTYT
jgi:hypothetical protein